CSHIFGLFEELDSMLLALMEMRAPSPGQPNGLEGPGTGQVRKAPVRPVTHIWTQPRAKVVCRARGEAGCSHIFGLFEELDSMLLALMEMRAPSPGQPNGLEGPGTGQVRKAPVRPVTHHRQNHLRNHGETCSSNKSV